MKRSKILIIGSIIASSLISVSAFASTPTGTAHKARTNKQWSNSGTLAQKKADMAAFQKNVTKTVTNISNGVQITQTTSDAATLAKLNANFTKEQAETSKKANPLITKTVTQTSNGIQTTITSTDAATVTKLQANGGKLEKNEANEKKGLKKTSTKSTKKVTKKTTKKPATK